MTSTRSTSAERAKGAGKVGRSGGSQAAVPLRRPRARIQAAVGLPRWRSDDRFSWRCSLSAFRAPPSTCRQVHMRRSSLLQQEMGQCGCVAAGKKETHPTAYDGLQVCRAVGSTETPLPLLCSGPHCSRSGLWRALRVVARASASSPNRCIPRAPLARVHCPSKYIIHCR